MLIQTGLTHLGRLELEFLLVGHDEGGYSFIFGNIEGFEDLKERIDEALLDTKATKQCSDSMSSISVPLAEEIFFRSSKSADICEQALWLSLPSSTNSAS